MSKQPLMFNYPEPAWTLPLSLLLVLIVILGFAALYLQSGQLVFQGGPVLKDRLDAAYFSTVTLTTVGYGDIAPNGPVGRLLVMWELGTAVLLLLGVFPIVVARIADF